MISGLFLTQLLAAQEPRVSLDLPILPLQSVLRELEAQTGQIYRVSGPEPDQRVYVSVKDLPASRVRDALAEVTQGRWILAGQTFTLETVSEEWLKDKGFRESVSKWYANQKAVPTLNPDDVAKLQKESSEVTNAGSMDLQRMRKLNDFRAMSPDSRLIRRLASKIPLAEMTSMKERERKVFSLEPTSLQKGLAPGAKADWAAYLSEISIFREKASLLPERDPNTSRYWNPLVDPYRADMNAAVPKAFLVVLSREGGVLRAGINVYWDEGVLGGSDNFSLNESEEFGSAPGKEVPKSDFDNLIGLTEIVKVDPEDAEFNRDLAKLRGSSGRQSVPVSKATQDRLANMDKVDPLLFGPTNLMKQFATLQNKSVVAKITDLSFLVPAIGGRLGEEPKLKEALQYTLGYFSPPGDAVKIQGELITMRPPTVSMIQLPSLMNRTATANFFKTLQKGGDVVDAFAVLCASCKSFSEAMIPSLLGSLFGTPVSYAYDPENFDLFKLYGQLTPQQRMQAKTSGVRLSLAGLSPSMNQHIQTMLLWSDRGFGPLSGDAPPRPVGISEEEEESDGRFENRDFKSEPTNALVRASLPQSYVTISLRNQDKLLMVTGSPGVENTFQPASPNTVAWSIVSSEMNPGREYGRLVGFVNGEQKTLKVVFDLGQVGMQSRLMNMPNSKGGKTMKFEELPADFQGKVNALKAQYKESFSSPGGGGGPVKPP